MEEYCEVCGHVTVWRFAIRNTRDYVLRLIRIPFVDFWICQSCGLVKQIPQIPASLGKQVYQLPEFRPVSAEESRKGSELAKTVPEQFAWITSHLQSGARESVLDVGAATGALLDAFSVAGWKTSGIEPTDHFADFARASGHDVGTGYLEDSTFDNRRFDLILLSHVLEHIHDPISFVQRLTRLMDRSSTLFVEVPDVLRPYGNIWGLFFQAGHVYHYTQTTLVQLLASCGLHAWEVGTTARGIRVLVRLEPPPAGSPTVVVITPEEVAAAIARYRRDSFTRRYVQDHLHWDVKLALHAALRAAFGQAQGQRAFEGLRRLGRAARR